MPVVVGIALYYVAVFVGTGARLPFMPVWFQAHGLSGTQMAVIFAAPLFIQTLTGPILALWADTFRLRRTPLIWLAVVATLAFGLLGLTHGFWPWLIAWTVGACLTSALSPLADVVALRRARLDGFAYAGPRGVGSAGFIFANVAMGVVLQYAAPWSVLAWTIVATGLAAVGAWMLLPADPVHDEGRRLGPADLFAGLTNLLRRPLFLLLIGSAGLIQGSHGFYYGFSTLVWRGQGLEAWSGPLWGLAVGFEVIFLWFMEPLRQRLGPERLLVLGGLGAAIRWAALALSPPLWLLFPLQALHALSYTATFIATLRLIEQLSPAQSASPAQMINAAVSSGLATGLSTLASGPLFDRLGARGYWAMSLVAGIGLGGALILWRVRQAEAARPGLSAAPAP